MTKEVDWKKKVKSVFEFIGDPDVLADIDTALQQAVKESEEKLGNATMLQNYNSMAFWSGKIQSFKELRKILENNCEQSQGKR